MLKTVFILLLGVFIYNTALAQKDTVVYYLKNSGKLVSSKDSADYFLVILPPDTAVDKKLFIVNEFYSNGKVRLAGNSLNNDINLKFQGSQIIFFPNGHKMRISNFENGMPVGDVLEYYPNGKLYNIKSYDNSGKIFLKQCNDTIGNTLAENGIGKWIDYSENFKEIFAEGRVNNGIEEGVWHGRINDSVGFEKIFVNGKSTIIRRIEKYKPNGETFSNVDVVPEYPGGIVAFSVFLRKNIRYVALAMEEGVQGRVIIDFVVEIDGTLSNIKVTKGIGDGCDEEAVRVIERCPLWKPGIKDGKAVRSVYSVPLQFICDPHHHWGEVVPFPK